jgi:site-specific DNA-adenine methylase
MGATRQVVPYQGSKWRVRKSIVRELPQGPLSALWLNDIGPWGETWHHLYRGLEDVVGLLERLDAMDALDAYNSLHGSPTPPLGDPAYAAQHLFLQRLAHSGKAVGVRAGDWVSPGFNKTSAYGVAATDRFGEVRPMVPSMIRLLKQASWQWPESVTITQLDARDMVARPGWNAIYIDPPYVGTTGYPQGGLSREDVIAMANRWATTGAVVAVSESEPIGLRKAVEVGGRRGRSPFKSTKSEVLSVS